MLHSREVSSCPPFHNNRCLRDTRCIGHVSCKGIWHTFVFSCFRTILWGRTFYPKLLTQTTVLSVSYTNLLTGSLLSSLDMILSLANKVFISFFRNVPNVYLLHSYVCHFEMIITQMKKAVKYHFTPTAFNRDKIIRYIHSLCYDLHVKKTDVFKDGHFCIAQE